MPSCFPYHSTRVFETDPTWERPLSLVNDITSGGFQMRAYMEKYGVSAEDIANVAVNGYKNAAKNPLAMEESQKPKITAKEVLDSPMYADPVTELMAAPLGETVAAVLLAPEDKRGRYMAVFGFHWAIPNLFGIIVAGIVMDTIGPNWVWYFGAILCLIAMIGFWAISGVAQTRFSKESKIEIIETVTS